MRVERHLGRGTEVPFYHRSLATSFVRLIRMLAIFVSFTFPGLWVALVTFHQELLPTPLALSVVAGREAVPLPSFLEALVLEVMFEIMREAGLRLPRPVGQAVSIVGALVIGQAAVQAGLVSPTMVIVIAVTGLASFASPSFSAGYAFRLLRMVFLIISGVLGVLGFGAALVLVMMHMLGLKSFGVDFLTPVLPWIPGSTGDDVVRASWQKLKGQGVRWWQR